VSAICTPCAVTRPRGDPTAHQTIHGWRSGEIVSYKIRIQVRASQRSKCRSCSETVPIFREGAGRRCRRGPGFVAHARNAGCRRAAHLTSSHSSPRRGRRPGLPGSTVVARAGPGSRAALSGHARRRRLLLPRSIRPDLPGAARSCLHARPRSVSIPLRRRHLVRSPAGMFRKTPCPVLHLALRRKARRRPGPDSEPTCRFRRWNDGYIR
jgi:hypothetical protein